MLSYLSETSVLSYLSETSGLQSLGKAGGVLSWVYDRVCASSSVHILHSSPTWPAEATWVAKPHTAFGL